MAHFCNQSRKGRFSICRKPSRKRANRTLLQTKGRLHEWWRDCRDGAAAWLSRVTSGWLNYCAVPGSCRHLERFTHLHKRPLFRALRRRSERDCAEWEKIELLATVHWPKAKIRRPRPNQWLVVNAQKEVPRALTRTRGPVRGDWGNPVPYRDGAARRGDGAVCSERSGGPSRGS